MSTWMIFALGALVGYLFLPMLAGIIGGHRSAKVAPAAA
jgi:hypothetical protein